METLLDILEKESEIKWFKEKEMIVNQDKFQAMIINKKKQLISKLTKQN